MLTKERNDLLTKTGPGTPAGELLRRYWQPVALNGQYFYFTAAARRPTTLY